MSRLQELIDELCPDGVEHKTLGEVGTLTKGKGLQKADFSESGVGCIHYGQIYTRLGLKVTETLTYTSEDKAKRFTWVEPGDIVIAVTSENVEDVCKAVVWLGDQKIVTGAHAAVFHPNIDSVYVAYWLQTYDFVKQKVMLVDGVKVIEMKLDALASVRIPVPPIEVQREIVRILDSFQELDDALTAEIEAREKQFEKYRDGLLGERLQKMCPDGVEYKTLGSIGQFFGGLSGKTKADFGEGYPFVTYMNVFGNAKVDPEMVDYVRVGANERQNMLQMGDVLFTVSSETPDECGMSSVVTFEPDGPLYLNSFCTGWRPSDDRLIPGYMAYALRSWELRKQIGKTANGVIRFNVSKPLLGAVKVPVPPIEVQREIVRILDSFQEHIEIMRSERDARRKQFEHYRDRLLTFPEKVA